MVFCSKVPIYNLELLRGVLTINPRYFNLSFTLGEGQKRFVLK